MTSDMKSHQGIVAAGWWLGRFVSVTLGMSLTAVLFQRVLIPGAQLPCSRGTIVDLELAGTPERSAAVLDGCSPADVGSAVRGDGLVILAYVLLLVPLVRYLGRRCYRIAALRFAARPLSSTVVVAAVLDVVEDLALVIGVQENPTVLAAWAARIALVAAWTKFVLLAAAVAYLLGALAGFVVTPKTLRRMLWESRRPDVSVPPARSRPGEAGSDQGARHYAICLSGGGVRSASFALGGLQHFDDSTGAGEHPLAWGQAREVSAVSGGAYMAAAWAIARGRLVNRPPEEVPGKRPWTPGSPEERHLILRLGYLLSAQPRGVRVMTAPIGEEAASKASPTRPPTDAPGVLTTLGVGLCFNLAVLLGALWVIARPVGWLVGSCVVQPSLQLPYGSGDVPRCVFAVGPGRSLTLVEQSWLPPVVLAVAAAGLAVLWTLSGRARSLPARIGWLRTFLLRVHTTSRPVASGLAALSAVLAVLLLALPALLIVVPRLLTTTGAGDETTALAPSWLTAVIGLLSSLGVFGAVMTALRKPLARVVPRLGGVLLALFGLFMLVLWAADAAIGGVHDDVRTYLVVLGIVALGYLGNPEWWSVAPFYRGRLRQAYATFRTPSGVLSYSDGDEPVATAVKDPRRAEPSLYEYADSGPELKICAAMTVSDKSVLTHYGIPAHRVAFERDTVSVYVPRTDDGDYGRRTCATRALESLSYRWDSPRLTTMAAVGMSGAAVAPAMGRMSIGSTDALLAFANVRLGVWIPNPRYVAGVVPASVGGRHDRPAGPALWPGYPRIRVGYLFKELLGIHDSTDLYVYVTDGGHWENTGLVDLLRDGVPDEVCCLDGSGNGVDRVTSLSEAIGLAHLECATEIRIDMDGVRGAPDKPRGQDYALRSVALGLMVREGGAADQGIGLLWYARPVLSSSSPMTTLAYRERDATFPATSTMDQFFDTEQFEAYRDLGRDCAAVIDEARTQVIATLREVETLGQLATHVDDQPGAWAVRELLRLVRDDVEYLALRRRLVGAGPSSGRAEFTNLGQRCAPEPGVVAGRPAWLPRSSWSRWWRPLRPGPSGARRRRRPGTP